MTFSAHPSCPAEPHLHPVTEPLDLRLCPDAGFILHVDRRLVAFATECTLAHRLVELLEQHGLADVPDHLPESITNPQESP